jgi:hypothetical protein
MGHHHDDDERDRPRRFEPDSGVRPESNLSGTARIAAMSDTATNDWPKYVREWGLTSADRHSRGHFTTRR